MALTASGNGLHGSCPAHPTAVARIRRAISAVARGCGADDSILTRLELAVTEAATNVVLHAYRDPGSAGHIHTSACVTRNQLEVTIRDDGVGMSPHPESPGLGLGLSLMAHEADACEITRPASGGTEIRMRFGLRASHAFAVGGAVESADVAGAGAPR
jgi:serine/threonine-protein kinase RsbW